MKLICLALLVPGSLWAQFAPAPRAAYVFSGGTWAPLAGAGAQTGVTAPQPIGLYVKSGANWVAWDGAGGGGGGATIPSTTNLISGDGAGNGADSGIAPANAMTLSGTQTVSGTKTFTTNILLGSGFFVGNPTGGFIGFNGNAGNPGIRMGIAGFAYVNTSGNVATLGFDQGGFQASSGNANFTGTLISPVINASGTYTGTSYGLIVAPQTNAIGTGTEKLQGWGTATGQVFAGYSEKAFMGFAGDMNASAYKTMTNCSSAASPAVCAAAASGSVSMPTGTTLVVNTTAVTANSQIHLTYDSSLGTRLGVTCDATPGTLSVSSRTAGTSFTISTTVAATTAGCISYTITN